MVVVLVGIAVLFMSAFYGSVELYRVRPGAVAASRYFYAHAPPGSVLGLGAPNVPARLAANYDEFVAGSIPPPLTAVEAFQGHELGTRDLQTLASIYETYRPAAPAGLYLSLGRDQDTYAEVLGYFPKASLANLDRALAESPQWQIFYRNGDAVIYEFVPQPPARPAAP